MPDMDETGELHASVLCKSCGLCCTGHLFIWVKLKPSELDPAEKLGMRVFRSDPTQRGFSQPCPLWKSECTIYHTPHYPRACRAYKCRLLKDVIAEITTLSEALIIVDQAKELIRGLETIIPVSASENFRERLVSSIESPGVIGEHEEQHPDFRLKAVELLRFFSVYFGVSDFLESPEARFME